MTTLQPFDYEGQALRIVDINGEPWFVASDVAKILGYRMASDMTRRLDNDDKGTHSTRTPSGDQEMTVITEPGLYVAVIGSKVPAAKNFKRWITHEVLPSIRKTGSYGVPALTGPELMARALIEATATLEAKSQEVAALTPKAEAFDALLSTSGDYSVNEAAKVLARDHGIQIGENRFRAKLEAWGWVYRQQGKPRAYQTQIDTGRLTERARFHYHPETGERVLDAPQVRVTAKGLADSRKRILQGSTDG